MYKILPLITFFLFSIFLHQISRHCNCHLRQELLEMIRIHLKLWISNQISRHCILHLRQELLEMKNWPPKSLVILVEERLAFPPDWREAYYYFLYTIFSNILHLLIFCLYTHFLNKISRH